MKKVTTKIRIIRLPLIILLITLSSCGGKDTSVPTAQQQTVVTTAVTYGNNSTNGRYVQSADARIYYEVYGQGQPLVVLHGGIVGSIQEMGQFIDSLSQRYKVIAISTRGHGKSEMGTILPSYSQKAKDVNAVLQQEAVSKAILLGFSDGAYTGYFFAKDYSEKIDRLVAIGAGEWKKGFREFNMDYETLLAVDSTYWQQQLTIRPEPERIQEWFGSINTYYNSLEIGEDIFEKVKCPVLVLAGEKDENAPLNTILEAYRMLPNAELAIIPNAPHPVFFVNFPAVWACVMPFLNNNQ